MTQLSSDAPPRGSVPDGRPPAIKANYHLLRELVRRDLAARFRGSALGLGWAFLQPVTLVALYWFVFTFLLPGGPGARNAHYADFLITGLLPWMAFNEAVMRSMTAVVENGAIVRRLPARSDLLVVVPSVSAVVFELIGLGLFSIFLVAVGRPPVHLWLLPVPMAIQLALQAGMGWLLAVIYVFFRDLGQIAGFALSILFYLSPILYPVAPRFERFFSWNPMTPLVGLYRSAMTAAPLPAAGSIVFLLITTAVVVAAGIAFFRYAQGTLADVI